MKLTETVLKKTPLMGVEPTTFELEVQRASPLRHSGYESYNKISKYDIDIYVILN